MLSFELAGGVAAAEAFFERITLAISAPSLGGVESLITRPATTSHAGMTREQRQIAGISDGLIRFSVGLEAAEDLIEDFEHGLEIEFTTSEQASPMLVYFGNPSGKAC